MTRLLATMLVIALAFPQLAKSDQVSDCEEALDSCAAYTKDLELKIVIRDQKITTLLKERDELYRKLNEGDPLMPNWVWVLGGAVIGASALAIIRR